MFFQSLSVEKREKFLYYCGQEKTSSVFLVFFCILLINVSQIFSETSVYFDRNIFSVESAFKIYLRYLESAFSLLLKNLQCAAGIFFRYRCIILSENYIFLFTLFFKLTLVCNIYSVCLFCSCWFVFFIWVCF